jgi:hypothetical protein
MKVNEGGVAASESGRIPAQGDLGKELQEVPQASDGDTPPHTEMSLAEILAPVHQQVAESGMTEEEVERLFEAARQRVREEKRAARSQ